MSGEDVVGAAFYVSRQPLIGVDESSYRATLLTRPGSSLSRSHSACVSSPDLVRIDLHMVQALSDAVQFLRKSEGYDCVLLDACELSSNMMQDILRFRDGVYPFYIAFCESDHAFRIEALQCGVDALMGKPYCPRLLYHPIRALLNVAGIRERHSTSGYRSCECHGEGGNHSRHDDVALDCDHRQLLRRDSVLVLSDLETKILKCLARAEGEYVTKDVLMVSAWGTTFCPETNVVEVRICMLRKKLAQLELQELIETRRGLGYRLTQHCEMIEIAHWLRS